MAKILLIEDDQSVQRYIVRILEMIGHEVMLAEDGTKGYELASDNELKVILTDLSMPGEPSEMELVRKLHELRPDCPIVVVSGHPTQERLEECEELGIKDFLTKPFEMSFIQAVLDRLLNERASKHENMEQS